MSENKQNPKRRNYSVSFDSSLILSKGVIDMSYKLNERVYIGDVMDSMIEVLFKDQDTYSKVLEIIKTKLKKNEN